MRPWRATQSHPLKTHKHLFERVCALEKILAASREALRNGKRAQPPGARYFADLEKHAVRLRRELLDGTYRHGGYPCFTVHEPKERLEECGRMTGGWLKQAARAKDAKDAKENRVDEEYGPGRRTPCMGRAWACAGGS